MPHLNERLAANRLEYLPFARRPQVAITVTKVKGET